MITTPTVRLIAHTVIDDTVIKDWLKDCKILETLNGADAEKLIELAGRTCYKSFDVGLNPNITKIRSDSDEYHRNLLESGHGSVLEHASVTFLFGDVSRVFTHELVRHRAGCAYSQESLRYVRLDELNLWYPDVISENPAAKMIFDNVIKICEDAQKALAKIYNITTLSFEKKKELTSAFRRIVPMGISTNIIATFNIRALRWIIQQRTSPAAETEIRLVFGKVYEIISKLYPMLFQDFIANYGPDGLLTASPDYNKV